MTREMAPHPHVAPSLESLTAPSRELTTVAAPTFKDQCEAVIAFCYRAHQLSIESAGRFGVSPQLLAKLSPDTTQPSLMESSHEARQELISTIRTAIKAAAPDHTGSFPDFLGHARNVRDRYHSSISQGLDPISHTPPSEATGDPMSVAKTISETLAITIGYARNMEQKQTALVILSALIAFTENSLPPASKEAFDIRTRILQVESESTIPFLARL